MQTPLQITYRHLDPSDSLSDHIRAEAAKLEEFFERIIGCHVAVEVPHRRHRTGRHYRVRVDLIVPGEEIVVGRDPPEHFQHTDPYLAVNESFDAAQRQLQDYVRRISQNVKRHEEQRPIGRVLRLDLERGYGFLETADGREIYFHRNSVLNDGFERLEVGTPVRFVEEMGEKGPQASTVVIAGHSR
jgi:ribosomal subunit interface protein